MGNCRPKKERIDKTIYKSYTVPSSTGGGQPTVVTISYTFTKNYWYELGPRSNFNKFIQNGSKVETLQTIKVKVPNGETDDGDVVFINETFTQQKYEADGNGDMVPVFERECRGDYTYDENYFYHIFEWPNQYNISREAGGFQSSTASQNVTTSNPDGSTSTSAVSYVTYFVVSGTVTANLTLNKVDSAITGLPEGSIAYHGGTDDNKIFFTYNTPLATDVLVRVGDVINGWTVSNVVNYVVDKAIRKRVTKNSDRGKTPSYIYVGDKTGIVVGDVVKGKGIQAGTTVTEISPTSNKISLSLPVKPEKKKKIKRAVFVSPAVNKVNLSTLCYAELTGGSASFAADQTYAASNSGASIIVRAGKGIIYRSAVVGMYFSNDKKTVEYTPLFYDKHTDCNPVVISDSEADYTLGTIVLNDNSILMTNQYLCTNPKTTDTMIIDDMYWRNFKRPVDKTKLAYWLGLLSSENLPYHILEQRVVDSETAILGGRSVVQIIDDTCGNDIVQDQLPIYNPYNEIQVAQNVTQPASDISYDPCAPQKSSSSYTSDDLKNIVSSSLESSLNSSYITMPEEMYNRFVGGENSLMGNLMAAIDTIDKSVVSKTVPNQPPVLEGENLGSQSMIVDKFRKLPPKFARIEYLISDFVFSNDTDLNPNDPSNKLPFTISSLPRWTGVATSSNPSIGVTTVTDANGFVTSVETFAGPGTWAAPDSGVDTLEARPYPFVAASNTVNWQKDYSKTFWFRIEECTNYIGEFVENKGNPFLDSPVYATLTSDLSSSATTINVNSTAGFLSSGYLIIPKYIEKIEITSGINKQSRFYYLGEEIIYYNSKTSTSFTNCTRGAYGTTSTFEQIVTAGNFIENTLYTIKTLGNTNWQSIGAPAGAKVGTTFIATGLGSGTGDAYAFESTLTPFENSPSYNAVIHSYKKGFDLAQIWPYKIL